MTNLLEQAQQATPNGELRANAKLGYRLGWSFTPLDGKVPQLSNWQNLERASLNDVLRWAQRCNLGLRTGQASSGIVVIDVDEGGDVSPLDLPATVTAKTGGGGRHYYFRCDKVLGNSTGKLGPKIDTRGDGGQVVYPGSIHPDTERLYRWVKGRSPEEIAVAELPESIVSKLTAQTARVPRQRLYSPPIPDGERNGTLTSLAGTLRNKGMSAAAIEAALLADNQERVEPPLPDDEVRQIARSVARYPAGSTSFPLTDTGLAERFARQHGDNVRYCHPWGKWLAWDGTRWKIDDIGAVDRLAKVTVRTIINEAMAEEDVERRKAILTFARNAESAARRAAMLTLARSELPLPILPEALDRNRWILNCPNGRIDLLTGQLSEHRREDGITKLCSVEYHPDAGCPTWLATLGKCFGGNQYLIDYIQRFTGLCLTGDVSEHILPIWYGKGSNGKSTILNTITKMLGLDYAMEATLDFLMQSHGNEHPTKLTDLFGKRLVVCIETGDRKRISEPLVKALTGGDPIRARRCGEDFWQFDPTHKLVLACNHLPKVGDTTYGMWRRLREVPFNVEIPVEEQDKDLPEKLVAEFPGILAWAVRGCLDWQRLGRLGEPKSVTKATEKYRKGEDALATFIEECCEESPKFHVVAKYLRDAYQEYSGDKSLTTQRLTALMTEKGFERYIGTGGVCYRGVQLVDQGRLKS